MGRAQAFHQTLPAATQVEVAGVAHPSPYVVAEGEGVFVYGTGDAGALAGLMAAEDVHPVLTREGRAIIVVIVCDFRKASHGPHRECHVTALVEPRPGPPVAADAASLVAAAARQDIPGFLSLGLWNDVGDVVAYNSAYLGLGAQEAGISLQVDEGRFRAEVAGVASVDLPHAARSAPGLMWRVLRRMGWRRSLRAARARWTDAVVINRKATGFGENRRAATRTAPDVMALVPLRADRDRVTLQDGQMSTLGFRPEAAQFMRPFRFAYLHPDQAFGG